MEFVSDRTRTVCGIWLQGVFTVGVLYAGLIAYYERDWQWLQFAAGAPVFLFVGFYWFAHESADALCQRQITGYYPNRHVGCSPTINRTMRDVSLNAQRT
jgi:hypothetical protein